MGRVIEDGAEMSSEEQQRVFGLSANRRQPHTTPARQNGSRIITVRTNDPFDLEAWM
jgi:hypothetical protein